MSQTPTTGGAILLASSNRGWDPGALLFPNPVVLFRYRDGRARLFLPKAAEPFHEEQTDRPLLVLQSVLNAIRRRLPVAGPKAGKPAFPVAVVAMAYEFGRNFAPHQACFPHAQALNDDELFAAIHLDAYRPDSRGDTERIGYSGVVQEGWMPGGPGLENPGPLVGHDAPPIHAFKALVNPGTRAASPLLDAEAHRRATARVAEYLAAGDTYQVNLTVPFQGTTPASPIEVFEAGLSKGGAAFGALFLTPGGAIVSFSPELLLRRRGRVVSTRPIKGTRRLGAHLGAEDEAREALLSSEKDRAEHLMIVDLERNDLGRVCTQGTVTVDPMFEVVLHPTVAHLESTVRGELRRADMSLHEVMAAIYPGGSVTGAPKKRAMEIIGELESGPRGIYCGGLGWIDADGDCDLNLPIRTGVFRPDGSYTVHAGGGVVADSDAASEWDELQGKLTFFEACVRSASG